MAGWTFITNHGAVLGLVAQRDQVTAREIAETLRITERSVHRIITDLESEGYVERRREGRVNLPALAIMRVLEPAIMEPL